MKAAVHGIVGGALNSAMGGDFKAGAVAGALTSLVVDHLDEKLKGTSLSKEERDGVLELTSAIIGKVSGEVLKDSQAGNMAAFTAMEATEYNYLSHQQEEQKAKELAECKGMLCRAKVRTEWELISLGQDASLASGFAAAVPYSIYELGEGIVYLASHPVKSYQAVKQLLQSEDVTGTITEAMRQEYLGRLQKIETEFQRAGAAGAFNAGFETGRIVMEVVGIAAGGAGIAKAGIKATTKVTEKLVGYAGKLVPLTTKTTAITVAETSSAVRQTVLANVAESQTARSSSNLDNLASTTSEGKANLATYPRLKDQIIKENLKNIAASDPRLAIALKGEKISVPNFSIGTGSAAEADKLGKIWVGDGYQVSSDVKTLLSADKLRQYRPPTRKISEYATTGVQANFQSRDVPHGEWLRNGHLNIKD